MNKKVRSLRKEMKREFDLAQLPPHILPYVRVVDVVDGGADFVYRFWGTGLNAIARESGVSKPNIYRYFESREAILLHLLLEEQNSWARALERRLKSLVGAGDVEATAKAFADSIAKRPRLWILVGALATVLEHNVGVETVAEFKRQLHARQQTVVAAWNAALPTLANEEAYSSLAMLIMAASGTWPHCHPAPVVNRK